MEKSLFEDLLASVAEAGSILRGEREPARTTRYSDAATEVLTYQEKRAIRDKVGSSRGKTDSQSAVHERE